MSSTAARYSSRTLAVSSSNCCSSSHSRVSQAYLASDSRTILSEDSISTPCDGTPNVFLVDLFVLCFAPRCPAPPPSMSRPVAAVTVAERTRTTIVLDHGHENQKHG